MMNHAIDSTGALVAAARAFEQAAADCVRAASLVVAAHDETGLVADFEAKLRVAAALAEQAQAKLTAGNRCLTEFEA